PIALDLDASNGYVYWIDLGGGPVPMKIARVRFDGQHSEVLVTENLNKPNYIVYNHDLHYVFWSDIGTEQIAYHSMDTGETKVLHIDVRHPRGFDLLTHFPPTEMDYLQNQYALYYVDAEYEGVYEVLLDHELNTIQNTIPLRTNQEDALQVRVYPRFDVLNSHCYYGSYCEQICFQIDAITNMHPTCACGIGFQLNSDGRTCSSYTNYFIYSTHSMLRAFNHRSTNDTSTREDAMPLISGNDMEMLGVRYAKQELYWINANRRIRRAIRTNNRTGWNITDYLQIGASRSAVLGLAIDWIAGNMYFSYITNSYGHLEVNRLDTDHRLVLRKGTNETIYSIAVNPKKRYLYWTDRGPHVRISRSFLNGQNVTYLITTQIIRPETLTIDYATDDVYWADSIRDVVEVMSWNGANRRTVVRNMPKVNSLLVWNNDLYVMDKAFSSIMKVNKTVSNMTQRLETVLSLKSYDIGGMVLFDDQPVFESPCQTGRQQFCEDLCFALPDSSLPECACAYGTLNMDRRTCIAPKEYLIVAMEKEIRSMSMQPHGRSIPVGISYDWVSDRLYWTDETYSRIISSKLNGSERLIIAASSKPRAIVVHPCKGYLFWSDVGNYPSIRRSSLTGRQQTYLITTNVRWPNGLTIDFDDDRIYWADAYLDRIERAGFDGLNRELLTSAVHPFAIVVHDHFIYWTDWALGGVYRAEKYTGANVVEMQNGFPYRPMDIHVVTDQRQKCSFNPCNISNGGCSHICKPAPNNQIECACPSGQNYKLANDRKMCVVQNANCTSVKFTCRNGQCIDRRSVCNGQSDCNDNSDEDPRFCGIRKHVERKILILCTLLFLAVYNCRPTEYRCLNGGCIPFFERCDRKIDCLDGSDENNPFQPCVYPQCPEGQFTCANFRCIDNFKVCNGRDDCNDGNATDEIGCPSR
ncbi:unnamed protein product, partial [Didymodactylos carnosus]